MTEHRTHRPPRPTDGDGPFPALLRTSRRALLTLAVAAGTVAAGATGAAADTETSGSEIGYEHRTVHLGRFEARLTVVRTTVNEDGSVVHTESEYYAGPEGGGADTIRTWVD
ncbi:hypothetical protein KIK06_18870 [Nocardiopsis sp. EMB25]|uniref:hypothetical protein n=1 Tax=Nocardiopsis sp. EMB25 TaxID=2835867 RepID=UPI002284F321|nr:hypothetical protein [Nocardiopsis sp. EMB25]MCY9785956.1 hypothetical protein [Nocardiopsis sp. EMB25]